MSRGKGRGRKQTRGPTPPTRKPAPLFPPRPTTPPGQLPHRIFTHEEIIPATFHQRFRILPKDVPAHEPEPESGTSGEDAGQTADSVE